MTPRRSLRVMKESRRDVARGAAAQPPAINAACPRPTTVGACEAAGLGTRANPCPYVSCRYHLALDVEASGSVRLNARFVVGADGVPDLDIAAMPETCALRAAEEGGMDRERLGALLGVTRERVRQIEEQALAALRAGGLEPDALDEPAEGPGGWDAELPPVDEWQAGFSEIRRAKVPGPPGTLGGKRPRRAA